MKYRPLGSTGVQVSPLCLGTAFRGYRRGRRSEQECVATFERTVELGCNFFDCANVYGFGESEELVGRVVRRLGVRERLVLTSKVGQSMGEGANRGGLSRRYVMAEIDHTLRRLQTDYLDVYFMHQPDPATPLEESLRALHDVVTAGKARYIGVSNHHPTELVELLWIADALGLHRPAVLQYPYSLVQRWLIEREIAPLCRRFGLGLIAYSPLAVGSAHRRGARREAVTGRQSLGGEPARGGDAAPHGAATGRTRRSGEGGATHPGAGGGSLAAGQPDAHRPHSGRGAACPRGRAVRRRGLGAAGRGKGAAGRHRSGVGPARGAAGTLRQPAAPVRASPALNQPA